MMDSAEARLQRLLGGDHLAALRKRLRRRFEHASLDGFIDEIHIDKLNADEHAALAALVGRPQRYSRSLHIELRRVDAALQNAGIAASLREALEQLDGAIVHIATTRLALQTQWSDVIGGCNYPALLEFLQRPAGISLLKRLAKQQPAAAALLCRHAEAVLHALPANGITRSQLAADTLGNAHALDDGHAIATLVLAIWRQLALPAHVKDDEIPTEPADNETVRVERDRDIWARAGVLVNELARPVLFLNLPTREAANYGRPSGEPAYASLRALLRSPPIWDVVDRPIFVCENPNLLAIAADRWGPDCAPLVCTDGMPAAAQRCLLTQLVQAGARLLYHGDFDWPGLRIGNQVMREHGAEPWRFGAEDYATAVCTAVSTGHLLAGKPVEALWDSALTVVMQQRGIAIAEEALAASLLSDLDNR